MNPQEGWRRLAIAARAANDQDEAQILTALRGIGVPRCIEMVEKLQAQMDADPDSAGGLLVMMAHAKLREMTATLIEEALA